MLAAISNHMHMRNTSLKERLSHSTLNVTSKRETLWTVKPYVWGVLSGV